MTRRIAEATAGGMSADEAFELAMKEEGLSAPSTKTDTDALHSATLDESLETLFQVPNSYEEARETKFDETELGEHAYDLDAATCLWQKTMLGWLEKSDVGGLLI